MGCREKFSFLSILGRTLEKRNEIKPIRSNCGTVAFSSFEILAEFSNDFLPPQVSPKNVLTRGLKWKRTPPSIIHFIQIFLLHCRKNSEKRKQMDCNVSEAQLKFKFYHRCWYPLPHMLKHFGKTKKKGFFGKIFNESPFFNFSCLPLDFIQIRNLILFLDLLKFSLT